MNVVHRAKPSGGWWRDRTFYSPVIERPAVRWPHGERVAVWVAPNVEHYEYIPSTGDQSGQFPNVQHYSLRDYGNRVGFWRMTAVLDDFPIRPTVSLNLAVLDLYPEIRDAMCSRGWSFMSHGFYNSQNIAGATAEEERRLLREWAALLKRHTGQALKGQLGPALTTTYETPDLMAESGLIYLADWVLDDQPVPVRTRSGRLVAVPYSYELNDLTQLSRGGDYIERNWRRQFDVLWEEGEHSGRVMCLPIHPFVIAQPHMVAHLRNILHYITDHDGVWMATAEEIAEHYLDNYFDAHVAHAQTLRQPRESSDVG